MKHRRRVLVLPLLAVVLLAGCQSFEKSARDAIAGAHGWVQQQQPIRQAECSADPSKAICRAINRVIAGEHTTAGVLNVYCAGAPPAGQASFADGGPCVPVKSAEAAIQAAIINLQTTVNDAKKVAGVN
jgi:hypothetical protein